MIKDIKKVKNDLIEWVRGYFNKNMPNANAVVGISGGKDSTVSAAVLKEALGKDRVMGVMMPNGVQPDIDDSKEVVASVDIPNITVNIGEVTEAFYKAVNEGLSKYGLEVSQNAIVNTPPRIRMAVLYAVAASLENGGLVANTCNASEDYVGYSTKFGDAAGDFSLLADLTVGEVKQLGREMEDVPAHLVEKAPSDGLTGKTDEDNLGFTYAELDAYIREGVKPSPEKLENIERRHRNNLHKLELMPKFVQDAE